MTLLKFSLFLAIVASQAHGSSVLKVHNEAIGADELVQIRESLKPITYQDVKPTDLAPESKIVAIYFDVDSLNRFAPDLSSLSSSNTTKQSQNFELGQEQPQVSSPSPSSSSTVDQETIPDGARPTSGPTSSVSTEGPSKEDPPTSDPKPESETTESANQEPNDSPVGSRTIRAGPAVLCGEANPNGKSNKRLILDRIIGGRKTEPGEFPFQVRLNIRSRRGSGICGGVILDDRHILTAAHCMTACVSQYLTTVTLENTGVHATIGDHSIRSNDGEVEIDVARITPHEKYDACNFYANDHDIAIIKTNTPIEYRFTSDGYGSINRPCMPSSSKVSYKDGEPVIVSGWGVTRDNSGSLSNILRYVQVPVVNVTRCQETYGSRVTNDHVCAGYQSGGKDSCQGDSGGPLVRVVDNRYELVGIVSFGYGCGQPGAPGVYTRVASYIDWIKANM